MLILAGLHVVSHDFSDEVETRRWSRNLQNQCKGFSVIVRPLGKKKVKVKGKVKF